jgi:hypothetical protein
MKTKSKTASAKAKTGRKVTKRAAAPKKRAAAAPKKRATAVRAKSTAAAPGRPSRPNRAVRPAQRSDDADAFIRDPGDGPARTRDDLAEALAEDFVEAATRGNEVLDEDLDRPVPEELGGPFVVTRAREELADDVDASNPTDAQREPLPRAVAGLVLPSPDDVWDDDDESS